MLLVRAGRLVPRESTLTRQPLTIILVLEPADTIAGRIVSGPHGSTIDVLVRPCSDVVAILVGRVPAAVPCSTVAGNVAVSAAWSPRRKKRLQAGPA